MPVGEVIIYTTMTDSEFNVIDDTISSSMNSTGFEITSTQDETNQDKTTVKTSGINITSTHTGEDKFSRLLKDVLTIQDSNTGEAVNADPTQIYIGNNSQTLRIFPTGLTVEGDMALSASKIDIAVNQGNILNLGTHPLCDITI